MGSDYDSDGKLKAGINPNKETAKADEIKSKNVNESQHQQIVSVLMRIESLLKELVKFEEKKETY